MGSNLAISASVGTALATVLDELLTDVDNLPSTHAAAQLRVLATRLVDALRDGEPAADAGRALEQAAIEALERDAWFRVYRSARRIVTTLTATTAVPSDLAGDPIDPPPGPDAPDHLDSRDKP